MIVGSFAPWAVTRSVAGGERISGVAMGVWGTVAVGAVLVGVGAVLLWRGAFLMSVMSALMAVVALLVVGSVRSDIRDVRSYLSVERGTGGISSPITRAAERPIRSVHAGWGLEVVAIVAVLCLVAAVVSIGMSAGGWLARRRRRTVEEPTARTSSVL
jgi:hypothetical protein